MNRIVLILKKRRLFAGIIVILIAVFLIGASAHAVVLESGIPGVGAGGAPKATAPDLATYINYLYIFVLSVVGIAGFISLVIWGTVWVGSAVIDKKAMALEGIKNTLIGIGIALTAFIMLYTINPDLTIIKKPGITEVTLNSLNVNCYQYSVGACPIDLGCEVGMSNEGTFCFKKGDSLNGCCVWNPIGNSKNNKYLECADTMTFLSCTNTAAPYEGFFSPGKKCVTENPTYFSTEKYCGNQ